MSTAWTTEQVMERLACIPDPEIPVISLLDLGIVRKVHWEDGTCVVTITPTYSGCPAMYEITRSIEEALREQGLEQVRVDTQLSPAWTTDWMSEQGKQALRGYGISPPAQQSVDVSGLLRRPEAPVVACPQCGSTHTRVISQFGSTPCKALYRCISCGEPFDYFKAH
ncbi:1,2-phenylacetyl-CoA epoxidase subunit PaaD [Alcaligenes sp. SDU_A2]|uniref:1,2-phenylacetyl-CoA epoxidase subunit PaaD n=1 Tax=Alcaligenes sp. SDU_A2 TaxID=3136634 RepID=UPI002CABEDB2|nr:phenylacetate-CoA oxygenase subunit PaaJ [Alcaligenes sp.]HRL27293.1 phenylacetate-CoA oxygenase subunit PaaJ [Alcaligenes sp.]